MSLSHEKINFFILLIGFMLVFLCVAAAKAWSCEPPSFPVNPKINVIHVKQKSSIPLKEEDKILLSEYEADRESHALLFNKLYPCEMNDEAGVQEIIELSDAEFDGFEAEMESLEEKWMGKQELKEKLIKERVKYGNGYYEVDLSEGEYNFE